MNTLENKILELKQERLNILQKVSFIDLGVFELIFKKLSKVYYNLIESTKNLEEENQKLKLQIKSLEEKQSTLEICPMTQLGHRTNKVILPSWYQTEDLEKLGKDFYNYTETSKRNVNLDILIKKIDNMQSELPAFIKYPISTK